MRQLVLWLAANVTLYCKGPHWSVFECWMFLLLVTLIGLCWSAEDRLER